MKIWLLIKINRVMDGDVGVEYFAFKGRPDVKLGWFPYKCRCCGERYELKEIDLVEVSENDNI
jgi:hypothetical protein